MDKESIDEGDQRNKAATEPSDVHSIEDINELDGEIKPLYDLYVWKRPNGRKK